MIFGRPRWRLSPPPRPAHSLAQASAITGDTARSSRRQLLLQRRNQRQHPGAVSAARSPDEDLVSVCPPSKRILYSLIINSLFVRTYCNQISVSSVAAKYLVLVSPPQEGVVTNQNPYKSNSCIPKPAGGDQSRRVSRKFRRKTTANSLPKVVPAQPPSNT